MSYSPNVLYSQMTVHPYFVGGAPVTLLKNRVKLLGEMKLSS